ncbi:uncharacterized protein LOC136074877 [Hydra vulgaris]|uniref:uncharacterized protein LOC136074877 n=1 Tax=Hydra vulgaris TaxID=6087 RepID=UPI0032EA7D05
MKRNVNSNWKTKQEIQIETKLKFFICSYSFNGSDGYHLNSLNDIYEDKVLREEEPCRSFDEKYRYLCEPTPFLISACLVKDLTRKNEKKDRYPKTDAVESVSKNKLTNVNFNSENPDARACIQYHLRSPDAQPCVQRKPFFQSSFSPSICASNKIISLTTPSILKNLLVEPNDSKNLTINIQQTFRAAERDHPPRKRANVTVYDHINTQGKKILDSS